MQGYTTPIIDFTIRLKQEAEDMAILSAELDLLQALFLEYCNDVINEEPNQANLALKQIQDISASIKTVASQ